MRMNIVFLGIFAVLLFHISGLPPAQALWRRNTIANSLTTVVSFPNNLVCGGVTMHSWRHTGLSYIFSDG